MDLFLGFFLFDGGFGFAFRYLCFILTLFFCFTLGFFTLTFFFGFIFPFDFFFFGDKIGNPKKPFSDFLKYEENTEIDMFRIDNTIVLKKRSQFGI